jgi:hypothetical protein
MQSLVIPPPWNCMVIQDEDLDFATCGFTAVEPPWNHGGVVHHQEISGPEEIGQVGKAVMPQSSGASLEVEQTRILAIRNRVLGD